MTRLRFVAGDRATGTAFAQTVFPRMYRLPNASKWEEDIREMKRRIEKERVSEKDRPYHLKLGPGGLSDIEFLAQYQQLRYGRGGDMSPDLCSNETAVSLRALANVAAFHQAEAEELIEALELLTRVRQCHWLLRQESGVDVIPTPGERPRMALALARSAGFESWKSMDKELKRRRKAVRRSVEMRMKL